MDLPTHCLWCGVVLMGGATKHQPECWLSALRDWPAHAEHAHHEIARLRLFKEALERDGCEVEITLDVTFPAPPECTCRTCGHGASAHDTAGSCSVCRRQCCWS